MNKKRSEDRSLSVSKNGLPWWQVAYMKVKDIVIILAIASNE
ncbi:MAG: hypothetical protein WBL68_18515 [Nitrososphaeraceae archaeon]